MFQVNLLLRFDHYFINIDLLYLRYLVNLEMIDYFRKLLYLNIELIFDYKELKSKTIKNIFLL